MLSHLRIPTLTERGAAAVLDRLIATAKDLVSQQPDEFGPIVGIGGAPLEEPFSGAGLAAAASSLVIALCGGMLRSHAQIVPVVGTVLEQFVPFPPRLVIAQLPDYAALAGACLLGYRVAGLAEPDDFVVPPVSSQTSAAQR